MVNRLTRCAQQVIQARSHGPIWFDSSCGWSRISSPEQERATARETVDDLRKRLDRSEERVLALSAPPAQPAPAPGHELPAMVEELRRRLETSEAHVRALVREASPTPPPPSEEAQDAFSVVEELRKRRQESKDVLRVLETSPPQAAQERPSETPARTTPAGSLRRFLGRLLSG